MRLNCGDGLNGTRHAMFEREERCSQQNQYLRFLFETPLCLASSSFSIEDGLACCCCATDIAREISAYPNSGADSVTRLVSGCEVQMVASRVMDRGSNREEASLGYATVETN